MDVGRQVEDLRWVLESPSLIASSDELTTFDRGKLCAENLDLDSHSESLGRFLDENLRSQRVGDYFESLVSYALQSVLGWQIEFSHEQIFHGPRTIGEVDFVLRTPEGEVIHLEVAIKFFLELEPASLRSLSEQQISNLGDRLLIGPNPRDSLHGKLRRIVEHQLPMSDHLGIHIDRKQVLVLGRIHEHLSKRFAATAETTAPDKVGHGTSLSPNHLVGSWMRESEIELLNRYDADLKAAPLNKPFWLSPANSPDSTIDFATLKNQLSHHFEKRNSAQLFSIMCRDPTTNCLREIDRVFIVADDWAQSEVQALSESL